jgi:hypothetical protein
LHIVVLWELSQFFWKKYFQQIEFSRWRKAHFVPYRPIQLSCRNTCVSPQKPSVLEAAPSSTLFPCENWVSFWMEFFLQIIVFKVGKGSFWSNWPIELRWRNTCVFPKNTICIRSRSILDIASL